MGPPGGLDRAGLGLARPGGDLRLDLVERGLLELRAGIDWAVNPRSASLVGTGASQMLSSYGVPGGGALLPGARPMRSTSAAAQASLLGKLVPP